MDSPGSGIPQSGRNEHRVRGGMTVDTVLVYVKRVDLGERVFCIIRTSPNSQVPSTKFSTLLKMVNTILDA